MGGLTLVSATMAVQAMNQWVKDLFPFEINELSVLG